MGRTLNYIKKFYYEPYYLANFQQFMIYKDIKCWIIKDDYIVPSESFSYDDVKDFAKTVMLTCDSSNTYEDHYEYICYRAIYELCLIINYINLVDNFISSTMVIDDDNSTGCELVIVKINDYTDDTDLIYITIQIISIDDCDADVVYTYTWNPNTIFPTAMDFLSLSSATNGIA